MTKILARKKNGKKCQSAAGFKNVEGALSKHLKVGSESDKEESHADLTENNKDVELKKKSPKKKSKSRETSEIAKIVESMLNPS